MAGLTTRRVKDIKKRPTLTLRPMDLWDFDPPYGKSARREEEPSRPANRSPVNRLQDASFSCDDYLNNPGRVKSQSVVGPKSVEAGCKSCEQAG